MKILPKALEKIHDIWIEEQEPTYVFRIGIVGGGCSGLQYTLTFEDKHPEEDMLVAEYEGLQCVTDYLSLQYLEQATLDYVEDDLNSQFVIKNPQASRTCGCGNSFEPS